MSSVQHLREFIRERLTAAAEEIFSEVEKTIVRYEEELHGLRRMMAISWKPELKLSRTAMELQRQSSDLQKPHVSKEEEASSIQQLCNQRRRSSHDQEEAEPQWSEEEQMEPDPPLTEEQEEPEPPLIEEQGEPVTLWIKEEEPEPHVLEREKESECPLIEDVKEEPDLSWLKLEKTVSEHLPTKQDQVDLSSSQKRDQLVQKQSIALMETSTLQQGEGEPRTEQLSFQISPVVQTKDQEGSSSTGSETQSRTDIKKRSFQCVVCGRYCQSKSNLKQHYRTHTGERPYSCQTCGKSFTQIGGLTVHNRSHTGERPYPCPTCGKTFHRKDHLKIHKRIHTGERPYLCHVCGKGFIVRTELNIHTRYHTGERPYSCKMCDKTFVQVKSLNLHMKQKHKNEK
ncbi:zinc finger protein 135 isoform X3 [Fundulus heteroclitus]|uniref:zinc finger protein 135 isoform X3 n=1 Tax=Fundulus heteroclitus TaxID=8078 RepID=UPI00165A5EFA|nr:zinc finger protein 135 isoform X3 [Fundulus heteroclitus]